MSIIAIVLIVLAFSCLIVPALIQYYDDSAKLFLPVILIGFFGGNTIALILLVKAYPALLAADCRKMDERYEKQEPSRIMLSPESLAQIFQDNKFKYMKEGYYRKKTFSFLKDSVCYYVRITEDMDVENAMRREIERLYQVGKKDKNLCMLLFVCMDEVGEYAKKQIKELGKGTIVIESVMNCNISLTVLAIAVDRRRNTGYYMEIGRHGMLTLYSYGCKMLRKLFADAEEQ